MTVKNYKILIIGGCGYIGSRLYQYLKLNNYKVDTLDLEWFGNCVNPQNYKKNYSDVPKKFFEKYKVIILLAGQSSIKMCESDHVFAFENNVYNFVKLLEKLTTQKFIYASSSSIYGKTNRVNVTENYNQYLPTNYYDLAKKEIDYYAQLSNINYYGLRLGTVCGHSPNLRNDVMINKMVETARIGKTINIYNSQVFRPILGIEDFCRAIESVIIKDKPKGIYNLASFNASVKQVAEQVSGILKGTRIKNMGTISGFYNFSVSTKKFERAFNFKFNDSIESIVDSLLNEKPVMKSTREMVKLSGRFKQL